jgi:LytS/YehU family sensor histidine kinase
MKKKLFALIGYSFSVFFMSALIAVFILSVYITPTETFARMGLTSEFRMLEFTFIVAFINGLMGFILRGFITWYREIRLKEELVKRNYEMELALVKNQINPHFLFNTINNIDVMIAKDAKLASDYLNKLSDIMRFMLYETKTELIPIAIELGYIEKYIDLQKIRASNNNYVNYVVDGDTTNVIIAPMLFISFIENAFKHTENKKLDDAINIKISITKEKIVFICENKFSEVHENRSDQNGLGNELIEKRLSLLYPNNHLLEVSSLNSTYKVKLTITRSAY